MNEYPAGDDPWVVVIGEKLPYVFGPFEGVDKAKAFRRKHGGYVYPLFGSGEADVMDGELWIDQAKAHEAAA